MNNKKHLFTLAISYEVVTEESAREGDASESGWLQEHSPASLRECLDAVKRMGGVDYHDGQNFYPCDASTDYRTGEVTREFIHVNPLSESAWKAWGKALKTIGL